MKSGLCLIVVWLGLAAAWAQSSRSDTNVIRGEIVSSDTIPGGLTVELASNEAAISDTAAVNPDSTFEFRSATPGMHQLRVIAPNGEVVHQEYVSISPNQRLSIRLPDRPSANHSTGSTVSLQQLQHKIPAAAQKAFHNGEEAAAHGNLEQARACFQEAVTRDPEFADAYNELGAAEAGLNRLPEAAAQFQRAIELAPEHPRALPNLSIVLAKMKRFHEAGAVARRALQVVPGDGHIHYILATSLMEEHGNVDEIILHLERAAADIPSAHITAAELLLQRGRPEAAIHHLEEYLQRAPLGDSLRPKVESRLAQLRQ